MVILVSACLAGILCKYDGTYNTVPEIMEWVHRGMVIPICPEVLGGGRVPREPNEIVGGDGHAVLKGNARVMTASGADCTQMFVRGAERVLEVAKKNHVKMAVLKERSPSCGSQLIYDGTFQSQKIKGCGVTTAILIQSGICVCSEENYKAMF